MSESVIAGNVTGKVNVDVEGTIDLERLRFFSDSLRRLRLWIEWKGFAGIEPHDALTSPLMTQTPLGRSRFFRLTALQALRRLPLNPRPILGIRPRINAISLGWGLKAYTLIDGSSAQEQISWILAELTRKKSQGYSGVCWGYYFDWQTRSDFKRANLPIVVSTAFIGSGLLDIYEKFGRDDCLALARSACDFLLQDLNRTKHTRGFCFSYSPEDHEQVYNASILGAQLLARTSALTGEQGLIEVARGAVEFVVDQQQADGSWAYAFGDHRTFIDNFHTGYVLTCLRDYAQYSGDTQFNDALNRGWRFYRENFFVEDRIPKYYHNKLYPIDAHAASQSIVTLLDFGDRATAERVAEWTIRNMQSNDGSFIYQIDRRFTNRISYLRWSNAYMMYALARLCDRSDSLPDNAA